MKVLEADIVAINRQISYKQKWLQQAETVKRYDQCEVISREIQGVKEQKRGLQKELSAFHCKEKKALWHQQKKRIHKKESQPASKGSGRIACSRFSTSDEGYFSFASPLSSSSYILALHGQLPWKLAVMTTLNRTHVPACQCLVLLQKNLFLCLTRSWNQSIMK